MLFNSISFLLYFPIVVLIYFIIPDKVKNLWLLLASYYFYMSWNVEYGLLILLSTVITFFSGILIDKFQDKIARKIVFAISMISNLGILFFFKYFEWLLNSFNYLFDANYKLSFNILLPVGISFYTFQALGYTFDVFRKKLNAETNFTTYALFVSFFPQLVAGPIERSTNLIKQLKKPTRFNADNATKGLQIMLWGYVEKMVIADNLGILVAQVYNNYSTYSGSVLFVATALFLCQMYCDFGGYSHIAIGAAKVLNVDLMDNFRQPFFSVSFREFWQRWHISLSAWFHDYVYIPLGGSRCSKPRKYFNSIVSMLLSGLWHGASWNYVIWGGALGVFSIFDEITYPLKKKVYAMLKLNTDGMLVKFMQCLIINILLVFVTVIFRATSMNEVYHIYEAFILNFNIKDLYNGTMFSLGLNIAQILLILAGLILLFYVDFMHEKGFHFSKWINAKARWIRWGIYYSLVLIILLSIMQTFGKSVSSFVYFQF